MVVDFALVVLGLVLVALTVVALAAAAADRSARAEAWRKIAQERRWNSENRQ